MDLSKPQFGASSSSSSASSSTHSFTHDVFLSFRGEDTRNDFTGHLHSNLVNRRIETFIDNDLTRGEDIRKELLEVIEGSRISIVVFSANYASSKWCLDELVKIFQCKESKQQIVYPIFYKVNPSDIRHQKGQVGAHLSKYKDNKKVESWKEALTQVATLSGWHISDGRHEATVIDEIVKKISTKIMKCTPLDVATYPVGIKSRVEDILKLLNVGKDDPHMIGMWGIGGIGKTTLAKAVYNSISHKFEHSCFLENVREESLSEGGLVKLQNNFLKNIERDPPNVESVAKGITLLKQKLSKKRVLLVLDDVDSLDQLRKLAGGCDWFGPRSKIIITTRDTNCLSAHQVNSMYEVKELNYQEALELFKFNAFKGDICPDGFFKLATKVTRYAKGIPLVLEVLGSDLCSKKDKDEWNDALEYYRKHPNEDIQRTLQRSYEALERPIREIFLHIACFFKGNAKSYVIDVLESCDLNPKYALRVLVEKALIKIKEDDWIWMHDLIEYMGKEIVKQEFPHEIGKRSRLWLYEDVREVLEENTGTDKIKAIVLKSFWNSPKIQLNGGSFTNLTNLQIFKVFGHWMLSGESVDYLPNRLRVLDWDDCSLRSLPTNFNPRALRMLHMGGPCTTPLGLKLKEMQHLKSIKLRGCDGLTRIPDLSGLTCLKELDLFSCKDIDGVDPSVGRLDKLVRLRLSYCEKLRMFPKLINLKSLETLDLSGCRQLEFFPEIEGDVKSLKYLDLSGTAIKELPCSVGNLTGLKSLSLSHCRNLTLLSWKSHRMFPKVINLKSLETLNLSGCPLEFFPEIEGDMKSLKYLDLSETAIEELPCSVGNLTGLESLDLSETAIEELPCSVGNLTGLESLNLKNCWNLTNVPSSIFYGLQRLKYLDLEKCSELVTFPTKSESLPPPVFSTNLTRLRVNLHECGQLKEISEFPREIDGLSVDGCDSLERISKLSEILEGKDSKMFGELRLTYCDTLCDNLAHAVISGVDAVIPGVDVDKRLFHLANKRTGGLMEELTSSPFSVEEAEEEEMEEAEEEEMEEAEEEEMEEAEEEEMEEAEDELMEEAEAEAKLTALLTLFFSCAKSEEFQVTFHAYAPLPNWFTCRQDVNGKGKVINKEHEFCIEIPQNSNWDNKGLALCIGQWYSDYHDNFVKRTHVVYIHGIEFDHITTYGHEVWVHYIPFVTVKERLSESGISSPDMFRVMFRLEEDFIETEMPFGPSLGVHLIEDLEGEGQ